MSEKIPYFFRQNSDFLYLTGCMEPDSIFVLIAKTNESTFESVIFMRGKDPASELWDGPRTGITLTLLILLVSQLFSMICLF